MKGFYALFCVAMLALCGVGSSVYAGICENYICCIGSIVTSLMALPYVAHVVREGLK